MAWTLEPLAPKTQKALAEISRLLTLLPEPARTIVAVAYFTAIRIGKLEGLQWSDWRDGCLYITRSIWRGRVNEPKTLSSAAPVPVGERLAGVLEMHWARSGSPSTGPIFRTAIGTTLSMGNVLNRQILPVFEPLRHLQTAEGRAACCE